MEQNSVISLRGVSIYHTDLGFGPKAEERAIKQGELVLADVNLEVGRGELVYLIGRVGSGKSTLLKTLYAEVSLLTGEGNVAGFDLRKLRRKDIPHLRRKIGIVFQDYQLLNDRNVFQNLYFVMKATGWKNETDMRRRADEVMKLVGLENKLHKMPFELSGGEQQRLVIARALLNNPEVVLADEPTGNLDSKTGADVMRLFHELHEAGNTIVLITHDAKIAAQTPRAIHIHDGKVLEPMDESEVVI